MDIFKNKSDVNSEHEGKNAVRVYVDMCADLMHVGHVKMLERSKKLYSQTHLIVGVHSDETMTSYKRSPVITMQERVEMVRCCKYVDEVVENAPLYITKSYIDANDIDVVAHAHDEADDEYYQTTCYAEAYKLGKFVRLSYTPGISTSQIIDRVLQRFSVTGENNV